jgi:type I restriction enzyme M protein
LPYHKVEEVVNLFNPISLLNLLIHTLVIKRSKNINPFAGLASFIKDSEDCSFVYAQELNRKTWAIDQLRLFVHQSVVEYKCEDSISYWPTHEKFDLIVSSPPLGLRLDQLNREKNPEFRTVEEFLLGMSINSFSIKGKSIAILSQGILFRGGSEQQRLRERLIQEDLIDTIISFLYTLIVLSISLRLSKGL